MGAVIALPRPSADQPLARLLHLQVALGGTTILRDVSLTLDRGEIVGLLGPNGAGKSTTLAVLLGLVAPRAGSVRVLGHDPGRDGRLVRGAIGVLPERLGFYDWMTAPDYLAFFARLHGLVLDARGLDDRLGQVGLAPRRGQRIGTFSQGMRQRLGLARALLADPALLVLDEPTSGLDPRGRREVHDLLLSLRRERGTTILLTTHLLDDVERLCDRAAVLVGGITVANGPLAAIADAGAGPVGATERFRLRLAQPLHHIGDLPPGLRVFDEAGDWVTVEVTAPASDRLWLSLMIGGWRISEIHQVDAAPGSRLERAYLALTATEPEARR